MWEDVISATEEYPVQQAMQLAREELHILLPDVMGLSLFLQTEPVPVFRYWTANQFRFASGLWDTREDSPRRIGQPEATRPLVDAWKGRRVLERQNPRFQPENDRFPYFPEYLLDVPLERAMFGVGFQHKPEADARWWVRELGGALEVGALREMARQAG